MNFKKRIERINKEELFKIIKKYGELLYGDKAELVIANKFIFTIKRFEVFFRLYINKDIGVCIRTNTLNSKEKITYHFVDFSELNIDENNENDIKEYRKTIATFYKNIIREILTTTYCPENHEDMTPKNATQEEIDKFGVFGVYEGRLLTELSYNDQEGFKDWIKKVNMK